ncbi:13641_t:CDS:2, partial [Ambispora gerdemannii]
MSYFVFGEVVYNHYKEQALVKAEVRKQIPEEVSDVALRKSTERARKMYKLFSTIDPETTAPTEESVQIASISIISTREPDQKSSTNIPDQPETNVMAQNTQDTTAEDTTAQNITSTLDALHLDPPINSPETVESLRAYEKRPDRMGNNFRWPTSMPDITRSQVFWALTDDSGNVLEGDREYALNCIYFYDSLDKGMFDGHEKDWVLIYEQTVKKYESEEYTNQQLGDLDEEMPGALYLPLDPILREKYVNPYIPPARAVLARRNNYGEYLIKRVGAGDESSVKFGYQFNEKNDNDKLYKTFIDTGAPETVLAYNVRRSLGTKGWLRRSGHATGYGGPAKLFLARDPFAVSIEENNSWTHWVQINTLRVWEAFPGDQMDSSLVGDDVLKQLTYVHLQQIAVTTGGNNSATLDENSIQNIDIFINDLSPVSAQTIVCIFRKAIRSGQDTILHWYHFAGKYDRRIDEVS